MQQQLEDLKAKVAELEAEIAKPEKFELWKPCIGEEVFVCNGVGEVTRYLTPLNKLKKTISSFQYISHNVITKTREQAERRAKYLKAWNELASLAEQLNEGPCDFVEGKRNWCLRCFEDGRIVIECWVNSNSGLGNVYFKDKEIAQLALDSLSDEAKVILKKGYS